MQGLNLGNYHPDHSGITEDWAKAVDSKKRNNYIERNHKTIEREEADRRAHEYRSAHNPVDQRNQNLEAQRKYKSELENQILLNQSLKARVPEGAVGLNVGHDRHWDKDAYKSELDHQVALKDLQRSQLNSKLSREDRERLERIKNIPIKDERGEEKDFKKRYKTELDEQNKFVQALKDEERKKNEQLSHNDQGLPLGKYNPDYKDLLDYELRKQIAEKQDEKNRNLAAKKAEARAAQEKAQIMSDSAYTHDYKKPVSYVKELESQIDQNKAARDAAQLRDRQEEQAMTGLPLGLYNPDYREELKRSLDHQVEEKRERKENLKRQELAKEHDRLQSISAMPQENPVAINAEIAQQYRRQLDHQTQAEAEIKKCREELQRLEELNNTGLKIGNYVPYDREAHKQGLLSQIHSKEDALKQNKEKTRDLENQRLRLIREQELTLPDPREIEADTNSKFIEGLKDQINNNSRLKAKNRERDLQEEQAATGLPLGLYNPDYREELKRSLDHQVEEKRERKRGENDARREHDRRVLAMLEEARQRNDPADIASVERQLKREYYDDLRHQAMQNSEVKAEKAQRDLEEMRASTGLPLGLYKPDYREELRRGLESQVAEKRLIAAQRKQQVLEKELGDLELQRRYVESVGEPIQTKWDEGLVHDLQQQMKENHERKLKEKAYYKAGDGGLNIGDYKGYDKQALIRELKRQIEEKENLAKNLKNNEARKEAEELGRRLQALTNMSSHEIDIHHEKEKYKKQLDDQRRLEKEQSAEKRAHELAEEKASTGLRLGLYNPDYREELKQGLLDQMAEKQEQKRTYRERELSNEKERLKLIEEATRLDRLAANEEDYYRELDRQVEQNRLRAEAAKRQELEDIAKSVGFNIGNYQGYNKDEFRQYLNAQIAEKETHLKGSKVANFD